MDLRKHILRKLYRRRVIGGKHTALEHVMSGIPSHLLGEAKNTAEELIKTGLVLVKPTSYGVQISLNPERIGEIQQIINEDNEGT